MRINAMLLRRERVRFIVPDEGLKCLPPLASSPTILRGALSGLSAEPGLTCSFSSSAADSNAQPKASTPLCSTRTDR